MMNAHALSNEDMSRLDRSTQPSRTRFAGAKSPGAAALQAMLWKEFRENVQWAVLAMVVVGLLLALEIYTRNANYQDARWITSTEIFPQFTIFMTPLVGLLLGLLQILPELRRDQWAFLVHRPVEHTALFWGKVLAGLGLYLLATSVPLIVAGIWLFTRTTMIVSFHWPMVAPNLVDILIGVLFYFGAILTAIRPACWYGSRTLPIAGAVPVGAIIYAVPNVWVAVACSLLAITIYMLAAHANFATFGDYSGQPKFARSLLGMVLSCGLVAVGTLVVGLSMATLEVWLGHLMQTSSAPIYTWEEATYQIDAKGRIVQITSSRDAKGDYIDNVTDLAGKVLYKQPLKSALPAASRQSLQDHTLAKLGIEPVLGSLVDLVAQRDWHLTHTSYHYPHENVELLSDGETDMNWFYSHYDRRIIAYSQRAHRILGYVGPSGFYTAGANVSPQQVRFPGRLFESGSPWWFSDGLYNISLQPYHASVSRIKVQQPEESIQALYHLPAARSQDSPALSVQFVLTDRAIEVLQQSGTRSVSQQSYKSLFSLPLEHDLKTYGSISVTIAPKGGPFYIWYHPTVTRTYQAPYQSHRQIRQATLPNYIVEVNWAGKILKRTTMPPLPRYVDSGPSVRSLTTSQLLATVLGCTAPAPLAFYCTSTRLNSEADSQDTFVTSQDQRATEMLGLTCNLLSSLVCAALTYFVARRCAFTRGGYWAWITGVFLLGPLGLCLLLAMRGWPGRVRCPACNKRRDVNREFCEHCGASLPEPQRDGTEIFELAWSG